MSTSQLQLFEETLDQQFDRWLATPAGAELTHAVLDRALALKRRGWPFYGIKAILEHIRFEHDLRAGPDAEDYKVNNNYASRLARHIMALEPELEGFFHTRALTSRDDRRKPRRALIVPLQSSTPGGLP